jgi:hypothetical protein
MENEMISSRPVNIVNRHITQYVTMCTFLSRNQMVDMTNACVCVCAFTCVCACATHGPICDRRAFRQLVHVYNIVAC